MQVPVAGGREAATLVRSLFDVSTLRATLAFWVAMFMGLLLLYGLSTWLPQLMRKSGFALGSSLGLLVMLNATAATGSLVGGAVADRLGSRPVVSMFYLLAAASQCALPIAHGTMQTYVLVGIAGVGTIGNTMLLGAFIPRYYQPHNRATGIGWALGIDRFGAIAGPLIDGWLPLSRCWLCRRIFCAEGGRRLGCLGDASSAGAEQGLTARNLLWRSGIRRPWRCPKTRTTAECFRRVRNIMTKNVKILGRSDVLSALWYPLISLPTVRFPIVRAGHPAHVAK